MKPKILSFTFLVMLIILSSCLPGRKSVESRRIIVPISDTVKNIQSGIIYALPRTVFTINVEMDRIIEKPGPYARYANDLLGLNDVILNESEYWSVRNIMVSTHEELDPSEYYVVKSNDIYYTNILALKRSGLIMDLNSERFDHFGNNSYGNDFDIVSDALTDLGSDEYFQLQRDTAFRRVNVDSLFIRIPYIVEKKTKLSVAQLAERAAKKLMEMREGKHLILTGEATVFPQSDAAIKEMNRLEKEYTELFIGKTWSETRTIAFQLIPAKEMIGVKTPIFRFSELTGPIYGDVKGGIEVSAEITPEQKTKEITLLNNNPSDGTIPKYDKLYYRVPDVVSLKISAGNETFYNSRKLVYQYGQIVQLPVNYIIGK